MLREYEFTIISNPHLNEQDTGKLHKKYLDILTADGGQIIKKDDWGTKKLAYTMKGFFKGQYTCFDYVGKPEHLAEAERLLRIDDDVLRYMSVKLGDDVNVDERKAELAKAAAKAEADRRERV